MRKAVVNKDCSTALNHMYILNVTNYLAYDDKCDFMINECNQNNYIYSGKACLVFIS